MSNSTQAFDRGVAAARAGKPMTANPYTNATAERWRKGYASVPNAERGTTTATQTGPPIKTARGHGGRLIKAHPHVQCVFISERDILPHDWRGGTGQR